MKYYIRSAGASPSQDYSWTKITTKGQKKQEPPLPPNIYKLIESEKFSSVLWRNEDELLLLITGLQSSRTDYQGRTIRNSILWIGTDIDEQSLRSAAIFALSEQRQLQSEIDLIIKSSRENEEGFIVTFSDIERVSRKPNLIQKSLAPDEDKFIGHNSEKLRRDVVETLRTKSLPKTQGGLVVVSELVPKQDLENAGVWRSLSKLVESQEWEKVEPKQKSLIDEFLSYNLPIKLFIILPFILIPIILIFSRLNSNNCHIIEVLVSEKKTVDVKICW